MPTNPGTSGLVAWWSLDGDGTDAHTGGLDLTATGGPSYVAGVVGQAPDLNGTSQYFSRAGDDAALDAGDRDFTIVVWFKMEAGGHSSGRLISKRAANANCDYDLFTLSDRVVWFELFRTTGAIITGSLSSGALSADTWYMVTAWHDAAGDTMGLQINDGAPVTQTTGGAVPGPGTGRFMVGELQQLPRLFSGPIDEVSFWGGRVLTSDERAWLYNAGAGRAYADLTGGGAVASIVAQMHHHRAIFGG